MQLLRAPGKVRVSPLFFSKAVSGQFRAGDGFEVLIGINNYKIDSGKELLHLLYDVFYHRSLKGNLFLMCKQIKITGERWAIM